MQINTARNGFEKEATRAIRDAAMLLLLRRPLRDTVTFCAFEKIRELTTAHKRCREQRSDCLIKEHVHAKRDLQIETHILICVSNISEGAWGSVVVKALRY